jgi:hypothetical protein
VLNNWKNIIIDVKTSINTNLTTCNMQRWLIDMTNCHFSAHCVSVSNAACSVTVEMGDLVRSPYKRIAIVNTSRQLDIADLILFGYLQGPSQLNDKDLLLDSYID